VVNDLAWLYTEDLGRPAEAVALVERFLAKGGTEDAHLLDTHGLALMRLGDLDAAERKLTACLRQAGGTRTQAAATFHLGLLHLTAGRQDEGTTYVREALSLDERLGGLTEREKQEARRLVRSEPPGPQTEDTTD
jgi:tetratricopeptide (TPR) repeat protein